jgi:hypothetical protein
MFWWIICCKNSALLRDIGKYLFNSKGKCEIYAIKGNISSNMPKRKCTQRNKKKSVRKMDSHSLIASFSKGQSFDTRIFTYFFHYCFQYVSA